ncbi:hypothetical protein I4U23_015894 [Adineta vaga]|nr:hypothetical protein I4U23_015894 [Adineta vaga]
MLLQSFGTNTIGWSALTLSQNYVFLSIALIGVFLHSSLWFQLFYHKIKFDLSFIYSLGYVSTDIFLFSGYFVQYGIRSTARTRTWQISCYFEAYFILYFNILESFYLACINLSRYWQIVRNENIYVKYPRRVLLLFLTIPIFILMNMIVQHEMKWCVVIEEAGSSCSVAFNSITIRVWNLTVLFALPIIISLTTSIHCVLSLRHTHSQQTMIHRNHHRGLIYRFFIFYTIWITLWVPFIFLTYLDLKTIDNQTNFIVLVGSILEASIDGILVSILDKRFGIVFKKTYIAFLQRVGWKRRPKIHPRSPMAFVTQNKTHPISKNT